MPFAELKKRIVEQCDDTLLVVVILLKGFIVAAIAYFTGLVLVLIMKKFGDDLESADLLKFVDKCSAAITYLVVVGKDLFQYTSK
jgi:hypothetical protein